MQNARKFDELCNKVRFCTRCVRMEDSARVLSRAAGSLNAPLMFIGEAPGRLGADAYEIPFHGDQAGHNFEELLAFAGLDRSRIFITNAVLCNPKTDAGMNATPIKGEIENCSDYLKEQINLVDPRIVVTLGSVALDALGLIEPHRLILSAHVRTVHRWYGRKVIPLYHPGARAMVHRSMANQRSDYQFVADQVRALERVKRRSSSETKKPVAVLATEILRRRGAVTYFGLHKLVYLVECESWRRLGRPLTGAFFLRQKDGPYCTDLHLAKLRKAVPDLMVSGESNQPTLHLPQRGIFEGQDKSWPQEVSEVVDRVLAAADGLSDAELKTRVYLTGPMRRILRIEKTSLVNLYNSPIDFGEYVDPSHQRAALDSVPPD
ncbi:MAG TPA: uracil-DNA glycosylase family protein [Candidatus Obscuribacterales bacterium]